MITFYLALRKKQQLEWMCQFQLEGESYLRLSLHWYDAGNPANPVRVPVLHLNHQRFTLPYADCCGFLYKVNDTPRSDRSANCKFGQESDRMSADKKICIAQTSHVIYTAMQYKSHAMSGISPVWTCPLVYV